MLFLRDPFLALMTGVLVLASVLPAEGRVAELFTLLSSLAVALLFFLHGAVLSRAALLDGLTQWRLHLFILATTFLVFPLLVLPLSLLPSALLPRDLLTGFLYMGALPSAISSSIALTAVARGNVPAAICSTAGSNVFGLMLTPFLAALLLSTTAVGGIDLVDSLKDIFIGLLLPFLIGQLLHPWIGGALNRRKALLSRYDKLVILIIIYTAFSQSVTQGLWSKLPLHSLGLALLLCLLLLAVAIAFTLYGSRLLGLERAEEVTAVFCGSKKSLATGLPLAQVMFAGSPALGMIVLPVMIYNQLQIMLGAVLAQRYAAQSETESLPAEGVGESQ
ncbi:bile acid:sodium symporter family protein [Fodinicurvata fenggangensis]|uniref:bile acid:sodium symporter family protein n=1 Tax=Fodinicurvata fenggangensis TaxID=1121830 RepID=UPI00047A24BA|nr:bile acid:sodium symporter family protein [Fodinicurvata fenggangensis]